MAVLDVETTYTHTASTLECDKCRRIHEQNCDPEFVDYLRISFSGGFASPFGDGTDVIADICPDCLKQFLQTCPGYNQ